MWVKVHQFETNISVIQSKLCPSIIDILYMFDVPITKDAFNLEFGVPMGKN